MKVKKFINKLQCHKYRIWILKNFITIYDGDLDEFIGCYSETNLFNEKIKGFYFCRSEGSDKIVIHIKESE